MPPHRNGSFICYFSIHTINYRDKEQNQQKCPGLDLNRRPFEHWWRPLCHAVPPCCLSFCLFFCLNRMRSLYRPSVFCSLSSPFPVKLFKPEPTWNCWPKNDPKIASLETGRDHICSNKQIWFRILQTNLRWFACN